MVRSLLLTAGSMLLSLGTVAADDWSFTTFQTGNWSSPQIQFNKTGEIDPGLIFISVRDENTASTAPSIFDNDGNLVWQGPQETTFDFKVQSLFGQDVITYWSGESEVFGGYGYGSVHVLDNTYKEIYTVTLQENMMTNDGNPRDSYIDVHEHKITPRNTMLVSAVNVTEYDLTPFGGQANQYLVYPYFYEIDIKSNKVVYSWTIMDHLDQLPLNASKQVVGDTGTVDNPWDPFHLNSVQATNEGFLVSIRHLWSAIYLNSDGSVRWQLSGSDGGDFQKDVDYAFSWQHDARLYNETSTGAVLSLFDNANNGAESDSQTYGLSFALDLNANTAHTLANVSDPTDPLYTATQGSFQFLDDAATKIFMGYGSMSVFKEFDSAGTVVMSGQFGALDVAQSYRGFKNAWTATPYYKPAIKTNKGSGEVYVSWNGATEYDTVAVYSLPSQTSTKSSLLTSQQRTGFETAVSLGSAAGNVSYVQAVAKKGGEVLGSSDVVAFS